MSAHLIVCDPGFPRMQVEVALTGSDGDGDGEVDGGVSGGDGDGDGDGDCKR